VAQQRLDLAIEPLGSDRLRVVRLIGGPQQQRLWSVSGKTTLSVREGLPRRDNGVDTEKSGHAMIWMQLVSLPRIMREHDIGCCSSDMRSNLISQFQGILEVTIDMSEMDRLCASNGGRCLCLLHFPRRYELGTYNVWIPGALRPISNDEHRDRGAGCSPSSEGGTCSELSVIRMRTDREHRFGGGKWCLVPQQLVVQTFGHGLSVDALRSSGKDESWADVSISMDRLGLDMIVAHGAAAKWR
jgi:hypothetical protein